MEKHPGIVTFQKNFTICFENDKGRAEFLFEVTGIDSPLIVYSEPRKWSDKIGSSASPSASWVKQAHENIVVFVNSTGKQVNFE